MGIGYLSAVLKRDCLGLSHVDLIDGQIQDPLSFWSSVRQARADLFLISATMRQWTAAIQVADVVRENNPSALVVAGGPGPSAFAAQSTFAAKLDHPSIDIIVRNEAEAVLPQLVRTFAESRDFSEVPNLIFRRGSRMVATRLVPPPEDLDSMPWPDRGVFDYGAYLRRWIDAAGMTSVHLLGSRGCPFDCAFCDRTVTGRKVRYRRPEDVAAEMHHLDETYHPDDIFFFDDLFTVKRRRVLELSKILTRDPVRAPWSAQGRVDCIDREMLEAMRDAGCSELLFGVESGSDRILSSLTKGFTRQDVVQAFSLCHDVGIDAGAYLIVGVPGEMVEDIDQTVTLVSEIRPSILNFSFLTPFPNTRLFTITEAWIGDRTFEDWDDFEQTVYDFPFEIDPRTAKNRILESYLNQIADGLPHQRYQFANSEVGGYRIGEDRGAKGSA